MSLASELAESERRVAETRRGLELAKASLERQVETLQASLDGEKRARATAESRLAEELERRKRLEEDLDRARKAVAAPAKSTVAPMQPKPASYEVDVQRGSDGLITKLVMKPTGGM